MDKSTKVTKTERDSKNIQYLSSSNDAEEHQDENLDLSNDPTEEAIRKVCIGMRPFFRTIERLSIPELTKKLQALNLRTTGNKDILLRRLKKYHERQKLAQCNLLKDKKYCPYFIVIDYEATCIEINPPDYPHEIIEFPAVLVSSKTKTVVDTFREYVRPIINPTLSKFCTELTGITQEAVDAADPFPVVLDRFQKWLLSHGLSKKKWYKVVTDGPWDMAQFLHAQCLLSDTPYPKFAESWINVRKVFRRYYRCKTCHLKSMLGVLGLKFEGRPHCGMDDASNIAKVLLNLIDDFAVLEVNEQLDLRTQKYRERALLKAAISTLESRDDCDQQLLQRLRAALALRTQRRAPRTVGFDDPEDRCPSDEEEEDGVKPEEDEANLRPKVLNVKDPPAEDSEEEPTDAKTQVASSEPEGYDEFSSQNKYSLLSGS